MLSLRTYVTLTTIMLAVSLLTWTALALLWIHGLSLRYPAPFIGMPGRFSGIMVAFFVLVHTFPEAWKKEEEFRRQKRFLLGVFLATEVMHMGYFGMELGFAWVPASYQWLLALLLPVMQEAFNIF